MSIFSHTSKANMSAVELNPRPVRVSPLIKACRWTFLISGILYGAYHHKRLSQKEAMLREIEERERPAKQAKIAAERKLAIAAEQRMLDELLNPAKK
ncbi:ATP synthase subunit e, mitochondrial-like [Belonocnema kinseyi]|uniref:ATP synthase subunit e, mitochondrial-like n=1 Tax=Belonocnema kinseyi TaxID=2817044 RepID=UPI00143D3E7E|nr:ATP synthase subunit e, mitochondrial-like [Belonocnema kinseyi]